MIDLPGPQKGVDDFIVAQGSDAFHALYNTAETLELWEIKLFTLLSYPSAIALNQRFLGQLLVPEGEKLIVLKAPSVNWWLWFLIGSSGWGELGCSSNSSNKTDSKIFKVLFHIFFAVRSNTTERLFAGIW